MKQTEYEDYENIMVRKYIRIEIEDSKALKENVKQALTIVRLLGSNLLGMVNVLRSS